MARIVVFGIFIGTMLGCASREGPQVSRFIPAESRAYVPDSNVYVWREVRAPGAYPWTNGMRLTDAILSAGGFNDFATNRPRVNVLHLDGTEESYKYDLIRKRKIQDPMLRPGDRVFVTTPYF
jgi:protein involved in polysaccharide export with SLBB domain